MKGRMKWFWIVIIVYIFFTLPLLIANVLSVDWFGFAPGKADAWIGFWGGYLGGVVGLVGVVATTLYTISKNNAIKDEEINMLKKQNLLEKKQRMLEDVLENLYEVHSDISYIKMQRTSYFDDLKERIDLHLDFIANKYSTTEKIQEYRVENKKLRSKSVDSFERLEIKLNGVTFKSDKLLYLVEKLDNVNIFFEKEEFTNNIDALNEIMNQFKKKTNEVCNLKYGGTEAPNGTEELKELKNNLRDKVEETNIKLQEMIDALMDIQRSILAELY